MNARSLLLAVCVVACGSPTTPGGTGGGGTAGSAGGGSGGSAGAGGGSAGSGGGGITVNASTACPHVDLGSTATVTYDGDTTGLPNWVDSPRLEWTTAPDDSLVFTAPSAGMYAFTLTSHGTDAGNFYLGVSVRDFGGAFYAACPSAGSTTTIDGVFESPMYPVTLTAGQRVLMYVSGAYWSVPTAGRYTLTIEKR